MRRNKRHIQLGIASVVIAATSSMSLTGCIEDPDCGICDPDNLVLESMTGVNYADRQIHVLQSGLSSAQYFIDDIGPCVETDEAQESPRGAEEYCRLSPLIAWRGLEMVFNNLLEPTTVEWVRKRPDNPNLFEIYDWKSRVVSIEGPITRFNGDYKRSAGENPDQMLRSVNLSCIQNLRAQGEDYDHEAYQDDPTICEGFYSAEGETWPLRMQWYDDTNGDGLPDEGDVALTTAYRGQTDWRRGECTTPDDGPDTCCNICDYEQGVNVAKYGVDGSGEKRSPGNAIECDPAGDVLTECREFVTDVNRNHERRRYAYGFGGDVQEWRLPLYDKVRETHPDDRPDGVEIPGAGCNDINDCTTKLGEGPGVQCVGTNDNGDACTDGDDCTDRHCVGEWFVDCATDVSTTGDQGYCVDARYNAKGAGACYVATEDFESCTFDPDNPDADPLSCADVPSGQRLVRCDSGENPDNVLTAQECCQTSLGGGDNCDPYFQDGVAPIARFDRDNQLPEDFRDCYCGDKGDQPDSCSNLIDEYCTAPFGDLDVDSANPPPQSYVDDSGDITNAGAYITKFVSKSGGVIYDPALKGVEFRAGDRGNQPRALVEACAESDGVIGGRNVQDGWRMHDSQFFETFENFDRALCSGADYTVVFAEEGEVIEDKVGNRLDERRYSFQTPQFHVVPGSGFPTDNLRIGACDNFELRFSNKFDLDPGNLAKVRLVQLEKTGDGSECEGLAGNNDPSCWEEEFAVAGGPNCVEQPVDVTEDNPPCLVIDVTDQRTGAIRVEIDSVLFGKKLYEAEQTDEFGRTTSGRYRLVVPGLGSGALGDALDGDGHLDLDAIDEDDYSAAFHDVCGMPLILAGADDHFYDFSVDAPKCKEDKDGDGVQLSCDNANNHFNPEQDDSDADGFGDVNDFCIVTASETNSADSDKDGVGNDCDLCRQQTSNYNDVNENLTWAKLQVRNIPFQDDTDRDGIGDVCDNCINVANCEDFGIGGGLTPHEVGQATQFDNNSVCQIDNNQDMVGDACAGDAADEAAGPVGFDLTDDFDQDGVNNDEDHCPRQVVAEMVTCTDDADCGGTASCAETAALDGNRYCNHRDEDGDSVGNECDTCPFSSNPQQVVEGMMQEDDDDEDFIGAACETNAECESRKDPRPYGFMEVAVNGLCCVTQYPGDGEYVENDDGSWDCVGLCDPDGLPIQRDCDNEPDDPDEYIPDGTNCRKLPQRVSDMPGTVELPPGCSDALIDAGMCDPNSDPDCAPELANRRLTLIDVPDRQELWEKMCFLPPWDQDFDGLGDACDLCPFAYDPFNVPYVDPNTGKLWEDNGKYCSGVYDIENLCAAEDDGGGDTDGDTDGDTEGGTTTGG